MVIYYKIGKLSALGRLLAMHVDPGKAHHEDFLESRRYILVNEDGVKHLPGMMVEKAMLRDRYTRTEKKSDVIRDIFEKGKFE